MSAVSNSLAGPFLLALAALCIGTVRAGEPRLSPSPSDREREVRSIVFKGNAAFGDDVLRELIRTKQSPGGLSQFFYRTFGEMLGSKPEYFDPATFDDDQRALKDFYQQNGFYDATVTSRIDVDTLHQAVDLLIAIEENQRSFIDSVIYRGLDGLSPELKEKVFKDPLIGKGMPYLSARASAEYARVLEILADNGYPNSRFDWARSGAVKTASTRNFVITLAFTTGRQYVFGDVSFQSEPPREDITADLALRQLDFKPGEIYSREKKASSEVNLNRLGLFEAARIDNPPISDSASSTAVPIDIIVRPKPRNEVSPELLVSDESNSFNLGLGLGYTNRNFFGDARSFNARARGRTQSIGELIHGRAFRDTSSVSFVELQFQLLQPFLFTRTLSGSWTSSISADKQKFYILSILRNKIGLSNQFATYTYGFFDWTLERVNPAIPQGVSAPDTILTTLREEDQKQFNSILTLTLQRDKTNDPFSPTDGFFNSISVEESGILPKIFPGIRSGLPFTQYYKVTLLGRWYRDLTNTRFNILAMKLKSGYQDKYGESRHLPVSIPLNRRFFAGGSGSVRGWNARELGAMADELVPFGGNFMLEGSVEMRVNHFRGFGKLWFLRMENIWAVYFLDFGNTWSDIKDVKPNQVAVAAGMGIRYETFFGPFRIDYGVRMYDPKGEPGKKTAFQKNFWRETLGNGVIQFGIGQAF